MGRIEYCYIMFVSNTLYEEIQKFNVIITSQFENNIICDAYQKILDGITYEFIIRDDIYINTTGEIWKCVISADGKSITGVVKQI